MAVVVKDAQGKDVSTIDVAIKKADEQFNTINLEDGAVLKIKLVATKVRRIDGQYDQHGNPQYIVESKNVLVVDSAPEVLQQGGGDDTVSH